MLINVYESFGDIYFNSHTRVSNCEFVFCRYRFVCHAVVGEKAGQDVRIGSRCLLDPNRDSFSSAFYENAHLYAVGSVYAIYQE